MSRCVFGCAVRCIDHTGKQLSIETTRGTITADQAIVTVPSAVLAHEGLTFRPALPDKTEAARGLPLGLADKLFLTLADAAEFEPDSRLFGRTDRTATATYHMRPFGRPLIEVYFAGSLAAELEAGGEDAFLDFASSELTGLFGNAFARRVKPIRVHRWGADPFARGSYSYALPGKADCRTALAAPVDGRLFFAGEACSAHDFSTAHGAMLTGLAAAEEINAMRRQAEDPERRPNGHSPDNCGIIFRRAKSFRSSPNCCSSATRSRTQPPVSVRVPSVVGRLQHIDFIPDAIGLHVGTQFLFLVHGCVRIAGDVVSQGGRGSPEEQDRRGDQRFRFHVGHHEVAPTGPFRRLSPTFSNNIGLESGFPQ